MAPAVSICIPAYQQPDLLEKNLSSVFSQTYTDYEVIATDDSRDDSVERLVKIFNEKHGDKIRYFKNAKTLGSPRNWNEAVSHAQGKYIKILHHDDWFASNNSLAGFVKMLDENPDAGFAFCSTIIKEMASGAERQNTPTTQQLDSLKQDPEILFFGNFIGPPSSVIYRNSSGIYFDNKEKYVVDIDFYIHFLKKNPNFIFTPAALIVNTSQNPNQVTSQSLNAVTQVGEYSYLFNKLNSSLFPSKKYISFFKSLFLKYSIKDLGWFETHNLDAPRPAFIFKSLISYLKLKDLYPKDV